MKIFLDTNVLVAAVIKQHVFHERSFAVFESVLNHENEGFVSSHSLAEMYSVLTKLPSPYRHSPEQALLSVEENVLKHFKAISLKASEYGALLREAAGRRNARRGDLRCAAVEVRRDRQRRADIHAESETLSSVSRARNGEKTFRTVIAGQAELKAEMAHGLSEKY